MRVARPHTSRTRIACKPRYAVELELSPRLWIAGSNPVLCLEIDGLEPSSTAHASTRDRTRRSQERTRVAATGAMGRLDGVMSMMLPVSVRLVQECRASRNFRVARAMPYS